MQEDKSKSLNLHMSNLRCSRLFIDITMVLLSLVFSYGLIFIIKTNLPVIDYNNIHFGILAILFLLINIILIIISNITSEIHSHAAFDYIKLGEEDLALYKKAVFWNIITKHINILSFVFIILGLINVILFVVF